MLSRLQRDDPSVEAWAGIVAAYKTVHVLLNQELLKIGLTFPQYHVVRVLGRFGAMPMNKLGEHMFVTPANITGLVDRLEDGGYVEREERGRDRRIITMRLTRKGKASYRQASVHNGRVVRRIMGILSKHEKLMLIKLLHSVRKAAHEERASTRKEDE